MDKADGDDGKIVIKVKTLKGGGENSVSLKVVPNMTIGELKVRCVIESSMRGRHRDSALLIELIGACSTPYAKALPDACPPRN